MRLPTDNVIIHVGRSLSASLLFTAGVGFLILFFSAIVPTKSFAQACSPTAARICVAGDDISTVYANGSMLGTIPYCNWDGSGSCPPGCLTVPLSAFMGTSICLAIKTQNTAPDNVYSSWVLDVTCSGGNHSVVTSDGGGLSFRFDAGSVDPANDGSGNPWYSPAYTGGGFAGTGTVVTGPTWGQPIFNPVTGQKINYRSNNASGNCCTAAGALYWRQCTVLPTPQPTLPPPNLNINKSACGGVTDVANNRITFTYCLRVCNTEQYLPDRDEYRSSQLERGNGQRRQYHEFHSLRSDPHSNPYQYSYAHPTAADSDPNEDQYGDEYPYQYPHPDPACPDSHTD
jgi:hypothetical protein